MSATDAPYGHGDALRHRAVIGEAAVVWWRRADDRGWREVDYVAIDFETTRADPRQAEPLSVGWVLIRGGRVHVGHAGYHLVDHRGPIPLESMRIHGLLPGQLQGGLALEAVVGRLRPALADRVIVAHGAWIERALLDRLRIAHGGVIDTLALVRRLDDRAGRGTVAMTLDAVSRRFSVPTMRAHHAFGDALTTALLLVTLAGDIEQERGRCTVDDLLRRGAR